MAQVQAFAYKAVDSQGARRSGVVEAENKDAAIARLSAEGRFVTEIREQSGGASAGGGTCGPVGWGRRPSRQEIALFTRRTADLSLAGLPLDRVLRVVAEQSESGVLRAVAEEALADVRSGMPVSQALARHPRYFPE